MNGPEGEQTCEMCGTRPGEKRPFFYGKAKGGLTFTDRSISAVKVGGEDFAVICDRCISRVRNPRLYFGIVVTILGIAAIAAPFLGYDTDSAVTFCFSGFFAIVLGLHLTFEGKYLSEAGSKLAIEMKKPGLKAQGYDRFLLPSEQKKLKPMDAATAFVMAHNKLQEERERSENEPPDDEA